jgi:hypothetical protein
MYVYVISSMLMTNYKAATNIHFRKQYTCAHTHPLPIPESQVYFPLACHSVAASPLTIPYKTLKPEDCTFI